MLSCTLRDPEPLCTPFVTNSRMLQTSREWVVSKQNLLEVLGSCGRTKGTRAFKSWPRPGRRMALILCFVCLGGFGRLSLRLQAPRQGENACGGLTRTRRHTSGCHFHSELGSPRWLIIEEFGLESDAASWNAWCTTTVTITDKDDDVHWASGYQAQAVEVMWNPTRSYGTVLSRTFPSKSF